MNRNKQTEFLGGIITLVILILLIFLSNVNIDKLSYIESAVSSIITPIQRVFTDLKNKVTGNEKYFADMDTLKAENEELRKTNSELETKLRELVTEKTAKVQVIIDAASTVSAKITTTEESIICKGTLEGKQILRASYIPTGAELIQGDNVTTSGIGEIYPQGIHIGTIKEIITTSNIIDRYAIVEPAVDFATVTNVLVVKSK